MNTATISLLQDCNHHLTTQLVQAKTDWETIHRSYRANLHCRLVYQTTLARIVSHLQQQQQCHDDDDTDVDTTNAKEVIRLHQDLVQWTQDCQHLAIMTLHDDSDNDNDGNNTDESESNGNYDHHRHIHRTPIFDYSDVFQQPQSPSVVVVNTSISTATSTIIPAPYGSSSSSKNNNNNNNSQLFFIGNPQLQSLQEQNDSLQKEIQKWQASMARIRLCNQREEVQLQCYQTTLRKVVDRIQQICHSNDGINHHHHHNNSNINVIRLWYDHCIQETKQYRHQSFFFTQHLQPEDANQQTIATGCDRSDRCQSKDIEDGIHTKDSINGNHVPVDSSVVVLSVICKDDHDGQETPATPSSTICPVVQCTHGNDTLVTLSTKTSSSSLLSSSTRVEVATTTTTTPTTPQLKDTFFPRHNIPHGHLSSVSHEKETWSSFPPRQPIPKPMHHRQSSSKRCGLAACIVM
jgi:hypothetical protein